MTETATAPATPPVNGTAPAAPPPPGFVIPKDFKDKITVNGQERELTYDEIKARAMKAEGAEERFKYANTVLEAIKNNPVGVLMNPAIGVDIKKVAFETLKKSNLGEEDKKELSKWFYENIVKPAQMDPTERRAMEAEEKNKQYEAEKAERAKQENETKTQAATRQEFQRILGEIAAAIPASGLPFSPDLKSPNDADLVRRIGKKMEIALVRHNQKLGITEAIALVKADLRAEHNAMAKLYNEDNLHEFYETDVMEKFNRAMLKKFKAGEKEKEKAERAKAAESDSPREPRNPRNMSREATRNANNLIRKISQGKF